MTFIIVGFSSFLLSIFFVWLTGVFAYRYGWVAQTRGDRWHSKPVALHGGIGIFFAFFSGLAVLLVASRIHSIPPILLPLFAGAVLIFILGWLDDRFNLKPSTKLIGQIISVSIPIAAGLVLAISPWHLINIVITFFWFIGIINAINLIDNMDGLASGVVMISTLTLVALRVMDQGALTHDLMLGIALIFLYTVAGFWIFNRYPASIFMGDSGSLFLGYLLAGIAIIITHHGLLTTSSALFSLLLPAIVLAIPIFDTILVSMNRKLHGRPASMGGRDHTSHRLVGLGFSEDKSVLILYGLAVLGGVAAIALKAWPSYSLPLLAGYVLLLIFIGVYLGRMKVYPDPAPGEPKDRWTPMLTEIFYKRHAGEVLLDFALISLSYYLGYYLRFEGALAPQMHLYVQSLPIVVASCLFGFYLAGVYRGIWHLLTLADVVRYSKGILVGLGIGIFLLAVLYRFEGYSRAVFVIFGLFLFLLMIGSRLSFRIMDDLIERRATDTRKRHILIYGAGRAGKMLYEECARNYAYADCRVVGFVDDDAEKQHLSVAGITIYPQSELVSAQKNQNMFVHELWVSSSKISKEHIHALAEHLEHEAGHKIAVRQFSVKVEELRSA